MQRSRDPNETAPHTKVHRQSRVILYKMEHTLRIIRPLDGLDLCRMLNHSLEPAKRDHAAAGGGFDGRVGVKVYPVVGCLRKSF